MIHLKGKTIEKPMEERFNLLFLSPLRSCSVKKFSIAPARKSKERQTRKIIKELYCLTNNQIVFTCHETSRLKLARSVPGVNSFNFTFFICLSLLGSKKLRIIQINFCSSNPTGNIGEGKGTKEVRKPRIINQPRRERSLWI